MSKNEKFKWVELKINDKGADVRVENVRLAFVWIAKPQLKKDGKTNANGDLIEGNYSVTMLFPKKQNVLKSIEKTVKQVVKLCSNPKVDKVKAEKIALQYSKDFSLVKDGEKSVNSAGEVYDGMAGHDIIAAKARAEKTEKGFQPKIAFRVVDFQKSAIAREELESRVYSGVWANVSIRLSAYNHMGKSAVTCYLTGIQVIADDTRLGGSDPFEVVEKDDSEDSEYEAE